MDLPAGRTTLKRLRRRLGFHYFEDKSEFWWDRIGDLETYSAREFAKLHDVDVQVVFDTRTKLLGHERAGAGLVARGRAAQGSSIQDPAEGDGGEIGYLDHPCQTPPGPSGRS